MSAPFANGTEGDMFTANRCERCAHWDHEEQAPCVDFTPAYLGEWPPMLIPVTASPRNPVGVECQRFTPGEVAR